MQGDKTIMPKPEFIDQLLEVPFVQMPLVSPNGKQVAWTWRNKDRVANVYLASLPNSSPKRITNFGHDTAVMSWSTDSRFLVVAHDYQGDERFRLYRVNTETGDILPLTEANPDYFIRGGQIHPDNEHLIFAANYDFISRQETETNAIYRLNLKDSTYTEIARPTKANFMWPSLNLSGSHIIYPTSDRHPGGQQICLVKSDGTNNREILNFGDDKQIQASWHPNNREVVFTAEKDTYRQVGIFNIETDNIEWLIDDPERNIESVFVPIGSDHIAIKEIQQAKTVVFLLNRKTQKSEKCSEIQTVVPLTKMGDTDWLSLYYHSTQPEDLVIHSEIKIKKFITKAFEGSTFSKDDLVSAEDYRWQSSDGLTIQGWLYRSRQPIIGTMVLVHGGPTIHSEDNWNAEIQHLVSQGFNVFDPNYRGSTGFNLDFEEKIKEDGWGGREQDDILTGIKSLIKDGIAEKYKVGITGTSYGGYSSWHAITHYPIEYVAAAIPICGMTDLVIDYQTTRPDLRPYSEAMMGGSPEQLPDKYRERSPLNFIDKIEGQLLIVQGANDPNVTPSNVAEVEKKLSQNKIPYQKLIFDDEGHGIENPENRKKLLKEMVIFFKKSFLDK